MPYIYITKKFSPVHIRWMFAKYLEISCQELKFLACVGLGLLCSSMYHWSFILN